MREIPGFPGYFATEQGDIVSYRQTQPRTLSLVSRKDGYMGVSLRVDDSSKSCLVHRLVAFAFFGLPSEQDVEVNHKDGNKTNNRVDNLEYVTRHENMKHARKAGLYDNQTNCDRSKLAAILRTKTGQNNPSVKLTDEQVTQIVSLKDAASARSLARKFGVSDTTIRNIWKGRRSIPA